MYGVVLLGAVLTLTGAIGAVAVSDGQIADAATATPSPEPREVDVIVEYQDGHVSVAANGGADLENVTAYEVRGATMNGTLDPDAEYPSAMGTVEPPATIQVVATFEDGSTQVVVERTVE